MAVDRAKLQKEYQDKLKELSQFTKHPYPDGELFKNISDYRDQGIEIFNPGGTSTSNQDRKLVFPTQGIVLKRGVKIVIEKATEPCVDVCASNADVIGICYDIDVYTGQAMIIPIGNSYEGWLVCKKNSGIALGDKLKFGPNGELDKETAATPTIYIKALSTPVKKTEELFLVKALVGGYIAK